MVAFGSVTDGPRAFGYDVISLGHVTEFLREYVSRHWEAVRNAGFKDPAFGFLVTLEKARRGAQ